MSRILLLENCTWEKLLPSFTGCPTPRAAHGMCAVGLKLVIFGGRDSVGRKNDLFVLNTGESTDSTGMEIKALSSMWLLISHFINPTSISHPSQLITHTFLIIPLCPKTFRAPREKSQGSWALFVLPQVPFSQNQDLYLGSK